MDGFLVNAYQAQEDDTGHAGALEPGSGFLGILKELRRNRPVRCYAHETTGGELPRERFFHRHPQALIVADHQGGHFLARHVEGLSVLRLPARTKRV
jgi:hypothetical protein